MTTHKLKVREVTALVNTEIEKLTGHPGTVNERHVFKLLKGEHRSPNALLRTALERTTGLPAAALGFTPRGRKNSSPSPAPEDDDLYRRTFLAAATAAGVSATTPTLTGPRRHRLNSNDVEVLKAELVAWTTAESMQGGTRELEKRAADITDNVIGLQQANTSSARIRSELYTVAAAFSNSAMWAAIDGERFESAEYHLDRTIRLAGLSGDPATEFRVWGHASVLFRHLGRPADALAAAERARTCSITRRDPLFASLSMSRIAVNHAELGDDRSAMRYLDLAQKALERSDPNKNRPTWIHYYDQAEHDHLAMVTSMQLARWPEAEKHAHRSLAYVRPDLQRNKALLRANLAVAQLGQQDLEQAVATAHCIPEGMMRHARVRGLLDRFTEQVTTLAPRNPEARDWQAFYRTAVA
ncbi:Tat pathway signal protein [Streptomyces tailanensis]|uniref:Tat pathway signal protein n=1 Tax=Streptomyces tailanensis TaxID=2569858 RepID=UPI00122E4AF6|nr:Tat pathway signal protein [Streptomyces tailanensis]